MNATVAPTFFATYAEAKTSADGIVLQSSTGTTHLPLIDGGYTKQPQPWSVEGQERTFVWYVSQQKAACGSLGQIRNMNHYHGNASAIGAGEVDCKKSLAKLAR
jgi:hypothetical protein